MSTQRPDRGALWQRRWRRRAITIPRVIIAWIVITALSPILAIGALVFDLATRRTDLPAVRIVILAVVYLSHEIVGLLAAVPAWLIGGIGPNRSLHADQRMQAWLIASLLRWAKRVMAVNIDLPEPLEMPDGHVVVLSRHASMVDAVLPALIFTELLRRPVHYVIKKELTNSPIFDIYGHRLDNHFVDRDGDTERETSAIAAMSSRARPESGIVIFPEGTYATEANRGRVRASLERKGDSEALTLANQLRTLLPPRTAGTLALLRERTAGAVVVLGHVGLEGMAELSGLRRHLPATAPVTVQWWCHQLADLPTTDAGREGWLHEQWRLLDQWVGDQRADRG